MVNIWSVFTMQIIRTFVEIWNVLRMSLKRKIVVLTVIVAAASYWLYTPLPPGYSSSSLRQFQLIGGAVKIMALASDIGSRLGFGTQVSVQRRILATLFAFEDTTPPKGILTRETEFEGVRVRIYEPEHSMNETLAGIVYYHGGGWIYGDLNTGDPLALRLCKDTRSVVVSVDYRLAPEFPFPVPSDDCTAATKYFLNNAADFHVDPNRVAIAGDSAGGNLAASVSLRLRDEKFPIPVKLQILIYPVIQGLDFNLPSMIQNKDGPIATRDGLVYVTALYIDGNSDRIAIFAENRHVTKSYRESISKTFLNLNKLPKELLEGFEQPPFPDGDEKMWNEIKGKMLNLYYSPLTADNLENLPEAYVFTANYDTLRDEGLLYAARLKEAKNKVTVYNSEIAYHGIFSFRHLLPEAEPIFAELSNFVKKNL